MTNVVQIKPFTVEVTFDANCHMFVGICDELSLSTEAHSFEALTDRVWEIAPEMAQKNLRLRFAFDQSLTDNRIAL